MQPSRLTKLHRRATVAEAIDHVCGGDSSARSIMFDTVDKARWIDPQRKSDATESWAIWPLAVLDAYSIYDDKITRLYTERCGSDIYRFMSLLRALDAGLLPRYDTRYGISMDWLLPELHKRVPSFGTGKRPKLVTK